MNAGTLQLISIIAFSLAGVLTLISIYLFFKMDVRGIIDDLSGKSAERQIMAMREENNRQKIHCLKEVPNHLKQGKAV